MDREHARLYESGLSLAAISRIVGVPRETLRLRLHAQGVTMRHVHPVYSAPRRCLDFEVSVLLGLHAGDGWSSTVWGISIHSCDRRMIRETSRLVRSVLGVEPGVRKNRDNTVNIFSGKSQARRFFQQYGFPTGRKSATVKVPWRILDGPLEVKRGFLRGVFSADGCFYKTGNRGECRFEVASKSLRDGFVRLASDLQFGFCTYSYIHHGGHNKLPPHLAYLGRQGQVHRWMREVGSLCDTHLRRYESLLRALPLVG